MQKGTEQNVWRHVPNIYLKNLVLVSKTRYVGKLDASIRYTLRNTFEYEDEDFENFVIYEMRNMAEYCYDIKRNSSLLLNTFVHLWNRTKIVYAISI